MNAVTTTKKAEVESVRSSLERMKGQFALALPKHLTPERLLRVTMTAVQNTPKLLECDRNSFFAAVMTCAQLGLEPDGVLGQAYLVPFAGKVQFIPGYRGLITLARNSGEIASIQAHEVCENDDFDYEYGLEERLTHRPSEGERGAITHFYAYAKFKDGGYVFEVLTKSKVDAIRDGSQGYQAAKKFAKNGVINSPWESHYVEMGRKTAIRRLAKYLPLSVQRAAAVEDAYDSGKGANIADYGEIVIDQTDGEVIDGEVTDTTGKSTAESKLDALAGTQTTDERKPRKTKQVEAPSGGGTGENFEQQEATSQQGQAAGGGGVENLFPED